MGYPLFMFMGLNVGRLALKPPQEKVSVIASQSADWRGNPLWQRTEASPWEEAVERCETDEGKSSSPQSLPASESFPMSQFFA